MSVANAVERSGRTSHLPADVFNKSERNAMRTFEVLSTSITPSAEGSQPRSESHLNRNRQAARYGKKNSCPHCTVYALKFQFVMPNLTEKFNCSDMNEPVFVLFRFLGYLACTMTMLVRNYEVFWCSNKLVGFISSLLRLYHLHL